MNRRSLTSSDGRRSVDESVRESGRDAEGRSDERMHADDDDRVSLGGECVERGVVEQREIVGRVPGPVATERRREQDRLAVAGHREGGSAPPPDRPARAASIEVPVHPWDAGRDDVQLRDPERLGVERDVRRGADDRMRVILVGPRPRPRSARLADPAVPDGLGGPRRMPQLDDPHVPARRRPGRSPVGSRRRR